MRPTSIAAFLCLSTAGVAWGQGDPAPLPAPASDNDPLPEVAVPGAPDGGVLEQAGVGGEIGYGRAGVLELGGAAGFTNGGGLTQVNVAPSIGWFISDNFELSGKLDIAHVRTDEGNGTGTTVSVLVEPSYHVPFNRRTFAFLGLGMGPGYDEGTGAGFAVAPRLGGNFLVGRSGILTPSLAWQYTVRDMDQTEMDETVLVGASAVRADIGYTVMW